MFFKILLTSVISFLILPFNSSFSPDFPLDLIQVNFNLLQTTFNNPENSFNVITDPVQRLNFLKEMTSSLNSLSDALSIINIGNGFDLDFPFINNINTEINNMMNQISTRASQYILPLNVSEIEINPEFVIYRLNSTISNTIQISAHLQDFVQIYLSPVLSSLNQSLYDLSVQINVDLNSFPSTEILASYDLILIKLSDLQNFLVKYDMTVIIPINENICSPATDCNLQCGIWNSGNWIIFPSEEFVNNPYKISCKLSSQILLTNIREARGQDPGRSPHPLQEGTEGVISTFTPVGVFKIDNTNSNGLTDQFIIFIVLSVIVFVVLSVYFIKKYLKRNLKFSKPLKESVGYSQWSSPGGYPFGQAPSERYPFGQAPSERYPFGQAPSERYPFGQAPSERYQSVV